MTTLSIVFQFSSSQEAGIPRSYGLTKLMEGIPPLEGMKFELDFRPAGMLWEKFRSVKPAWLSEDARIVTEVTRVLAREHAYEDKPSEIVYRVTLMPVTPTGRELYDAVKSGWALQCGWDIRMD